MTSAGGGSKGQYCLSKTEKQFIFDEMDRHNDPEQLQKNWISSSSKKQRWKN
jgi:hypothetical protein